MMPDNNTIPLAVPNTRYQDCETNFREIVISDFRYNRHLIQQTFNVWKYTSMWRYLQMAVLIKSGHSYTEIETLLDIIYVVYVDRNTKAKNKILFYGKIKV